MGRWIRQSLILMTRPCKVSIGLAWGSLTHPYMEITYASRPKALPCNQIFIYVRVILSILGPLFLQGNGQMDDNCDRWCGIAKFNELEKSGANVKLCYMA